MRYPKLSDYEKLLSGKKCFDCGNDLTGIPLSHYKHPEGWHVDGFTEKRWLYASCTKGRCCYQTSLAKLYFARPVPEELSHLMDESEGDDTPVKVTHSFTNDDPELIAEFKRKALERISGLMNPDKIRL